MESAKQKFQVIGSATEANVKEIVDHTTANVAALPASEPQKPGYPKTISSKTAEKDREKGNVVSKAHLTNKLNYINFQDGTLLVILKHIKYDKTITLHAKPQPCLGDLLDCLWTETADIQQIIKSFQFKNLLVNDGQKLLLVEPELIRMDEEGISFLLPEASYEVSARRVTRHLCEGIAVQFFQNSSVFTGVLLDFNVRSFSVEVTATPPQTFEWINPEASVNIILSDGGETLYTGECKITRQTHGHKTRTFVLTSLRQEIQRFKHKEFRSDRQILNPSPNVVFRHPIIKKVVNLKVVDLSGSGFSVEEDEKNAVLLPGMNLPELELSFANSFRIKCRAQVVYRKEMDSSQQGRWIKCGLALLDMDIQDHVKLVGMLHQANNRNSYISNNVDLDDLWDFFFETGFIYPKKYAFIQKNKKQIKETYEKLYTRNPHIARHFIFQDKGRILGHMATLRFYENAWLIHHHAARKSALNKAGLIVLDQIGRFTYDSYRLYSMHMNYMICYYRPDNKFPSRVFGGAADAINDPAGCSVDSFGYFHYPVNSSPKTNWSDEWEMTETHHQDLQELEIYYSHVHGGLMLNALDITQENFNCDDLSEMYRQLGLKRERHLFSIKRNGSLKAIIMVILSDLGLNLSDLTNCIKVFVVDSDEFPSDVFKTVLSKLAEKFGHRDMPVLLYPVAYADEQGIHYEKIYNLWICSLQYSDQYFNYLKRLLRFI